MKNNVKLLKDLFTKVATVYKSGIYILGNRYIVGDMYSEDEVYGAVFIEIDIDVIPIFKELNPKNKDIYIAKISTIKDLFRNYPDTNDIDDVCYIHNYFESPNRDFLTVFRERIDELNSYYDMPDVDWVEISDILTEDNIIDIFVKNTVTRIEHNGNGYDIIKPLIPTLTKKNIKGQFGFTKNGLLLITIPVGDVLTINSGYRYVV